MPYYKFESEDIFYNRIEAHPRCLFYIYSGSVFYNNMPVRPGTTLHGLKNSDIAGTPVGNANLYELNVDRNKAQHDWQLQKLVEGAPVGIHASENDAVLGQTSNGYAPAVGRNVADGGAGSLTDYRSNTKRKTMIYQFTTKDGGGEMFKTITSGSYNQAEWGAIFSSSTSYPLSASIQREYYYSNSAGLEGDGLWVLDDPNKPQSGDHQDTIVWNQKHVKRGSLDKVLVRWSRLDALKTVFDSYTYLSPHYAFSSSHPGWDFGTQEGTTYGGKNHQEINLISIPSIFYGSSIRKGSVKLRFYISGTLAAECADIYKNGELVEVTCSSRPVAELVPETYWDDSRTTHGKRGKVAGVILYDHGYIALTGSWDLGSNHTEVYTVPGPTINVARGPEKPRWTYFGTGIERPGTPAQHGEDRFITGSHSQFNLPSSSFSIEFEGINYTPTVTMMAHAPAGKLNHSNNPTYVKANATKPDSVKVVGGNIIFKHSGSIWPVHSGSNFYSQNKYVSVKNTVSSSYANHTASYAKQTYISKIGIYDENYNLIGIAKMANPIKKTEDRDLTFKLKYDF